MKARSIIKELTKGFIRESAIKELTWRGHDIWKNNNLAVKGRKFIGRLGVSDVIGITKDGRWVACEIKTLNDRLSPDQIDFLNDVKKAGGLAYVACQGNNGQVELRAEIKEIVNSLPENILAQPATIWNESEDSGHCVTGIKTLDQSLPIFYRLDL